MEDHDFLILTTILGAPKRQKYVTYFKPQRLHHLHAWSLRAILGFATATAGLSTHIGFVIVTRGLSINTGFVIVTTGLSINTGFVIVTTGLSINTGFVIATTGDIITIRIAVAIVPTYWSQHQY